MLTTKNSYSTTILTLLGQNLVDTKHKLIIITHFDDTYQIGYLVSP